MSNRKSGLYDPGAVSGGYSEADIALKWALTIKHIGIHRFGIDPDKIVLTRTSARDHCPVWRRDDIAREQKATHFLSLHMNASVSPLANGTETFWPGYNNTDDFLFAQEIQGIALDAMETRNRGVKTPSQSQHKSLAVFASAKYMSACLLEIGFITNAEDRKKALDRDRRIAFADKLFEFVL